MIIDGEDLADGTALDAEVVVVGAGPAGIVTALELASAGVDVLLVESGRTTPDPRAQELADAELADPRLHAPMAMTTRRQIGGTSRIWGGRCVPFDPIDFERRELVGDAAWPVGHADVLPYFGRACDWLVCGRPVFDADAIPGLPPLVPGFPDGPVRSSALERWSLPTDFGHEYGERLRDDPRVRVASGVTCTEVVCADGEPRVSHIAARGLDGRGLRLTGRRYVLACGGLETTRLLLASRGPGGRAVGDHAGHLGRWYMAHVEGGVARVRFTTPPGATQYGYARDVDGVYVRRRLSFATETLRERGLPNVVAWLANPDLPDPAHRSGAAVLRLPRARLPGRAALRPGCAAPVADRAPRARRALRRVAPRTRPGAPAQPRGAPRRDGEVRRGVRHPAVRRPPPRPGFFVGNPQNAYPLQYHGEHLPQRDSRVTLTGDRDRLGMPKLRIDLRFSDADVDGIVRAHEAWDEHLRAHGIGALEYRSPDVAGEVRARIGGGFHQSGTTRMSARPEDGVVDADLAVHGFRDLFVAGSSTFVTSGQANSTFTIVAFAVRLADHLKALRRS